jgi:ABC-type Fe3+ transport system substrate-binding protein
VPGVLYNKQRAPEFAQVRMMDDLLKPEYKGKFGTTSFAAGFDVLLGKDAWGEEKVSAFLVKFAKQAAGILPCGGEDRIASGEFLALALDCAGGTQLTARYKDHLALQVPADNAQRRLSYLMVPKNAAHPNLAILYTLFFASPEGQQISRESWGLQLYEFEETQRHKEIAAIEATGVKFRDVTIDWWQANPGIDEANNRLGKIVRDTIAK